VFNLLSLLLVFIGGGAGAVSRYVLSTAVNARLSSVFPYGTLSANVIGSFLIGILSALLLKEQFLPVAKSARLLLIVGFLGGFTTFSSFSMETVSLFLSEEYLKALFNIVLNTCLCIGAAFLGLLLIKAFA